MSGVEANPKLVYWFLAVQTITLFYGDYGWKEVILSGQ